MLKFLIFFGIFCTAATVHKISKHHDKDKIVNLALETVFEFDKDNKETDVNILSKVQNFIGRVKNAIKNQKASRRSMSHENKNIFTNFIVNLIQILMKYDDHDLEDFALIISNEMKNHRGSKFHELAETIDFQKFFGDKLAKIRNKPAADIRLHLDTLRHKLGEGKYVKNEEELWDTINYMYQDDSVTKFNKFVADIDDYRLKSRKNIDLSQIVKGGLKSILFDHYSRLSINLRSILMSKLQYYMKYYYKNHQNDAKYTTNIQTSSELRTLRQINVEKNLRLMKHNYDKWLKEIKRKKHSTTHMTRRPHSVPTTKKKLQIIKDDDVKPAEEYKKFINVKVTTRYYKDTSAYKKRGDKTTEELRTLRQMYVEKNLDLKYDPDAYEHLTTDIKRNTKTINPSTSPTTLNRRPNKNSHKYILRSHSLLRQSMKSKHVQKQDSHSFDESKIKSDDLDSKSEDLTSKLISEQQTSSKYIDTTKFKLTKMARQFGQTFINKDLDYKYNFKPEYRSQKKNTTFKILQPTFEMKWSTTKSRNSKMNFSVSRSEYKMRSVKFGSSANTELYTFVPGRPNVIEIVNDIDYSFDIKKGRDLDLSDHKSDVHNSKYKKRHFHKDISRIFKDRLTKTTELKLVHKPVFRRQNRESLRTKLKISREPLILSRRYDSPHNVGRQQYRRRYTEGPIVSEEGLSIEEFGSVNRKKYYRRNENPDTTANIDNNTHVLERIQKLENDLKLVKTQIKNDTKIKDLSLNNDNSLVIQPEKSTYSINLKPDVDVDNILQPKNINNGFSTETSEIYENTIIEKSPNLNKKKQVIEPKYDVNRINIKSKIDNDVFNLPLKATTVSKQTSTLESNIIDQGRKNFLDLKQIESQSDKEKLNKNPDDSDSSNSESKNHVDHSFTTNKIKQILNDVNGKEKDSVKGTTEKVFYFRVNKKINEKRFNRTETTKSKYSSTVSPFTNITFVNQSEDKLNKSWVEVNRQFNNRDENIPVKWNDFKENLKEQATRIELKLNSTNTVKDDQKINSSGIAFRARIDDTTFMQTTNKTFDDFDERFTKNYSDFPKANEEFKTNGTVTNASTSQETQTTETNSSDSKAITHKLVKLGKEVGGQLAGLLNANDFKERNGASDKDKDAMDIHLVLNLGPSQSVINDTFSRQQNSITIQIPSTITGFMYPKV